MTTRIRNAALWKCARAVVLVPSAMLGLATTVLAQQIPAFPDADSFDNGEHPDDPVWSNTGTGQGWAFLGSQIAGGTQDPNATAQILSGGPTGKYGRLDGPDGTGVSFSTLTQPVFGSFSFNTMFDAYNPSKTGFQQFWLNNQPGEYAFGQKPFIYFSTQSDNKVTMEFARQDATNYTDDRSIHTGTWYNFDINYAITAGQGEWTLKVKDLAGNTAFNEGTVYHWDASSGPSALEWATFVKMDNTEDNRPSPGWNIDEVNTTPPARPANFGNQRVRSKDFQIMGAVLGGNFDLDTYHNAGFNEVFVNNDNDLAQEMVNEGQDFQFHYNPGLNYQPYNASGEIFLNKLASKGGLEHNTGINNFQAVMLPDEPQTVDDLNNLAQSNAWLHHFRPDVMTYVNVASSEDSAFMQQIVDIVKPDALSFDIYPILSSDEPGTVDGFDRGGFFRSTMRVRAVCLAANIPFFVFTQATNFGDSIPELDRQPSESEMRLNIWGTLAAGAKGINYYNYTDLGRRSYFFDENGGTTQFYADAASANHEIAHLGKSLRFLTSTDVRFVGGGVSATPPELTNWDTTAGTGHHVLSLSVNGTPTQDKDGLIGYFTDDSAAEYFMLVNMHTDPTLNAAQTALGFHLTFDNSIAQLKRLNRLTGEPERVLLTNHALDLTLPGGTGDLFGFNFGSFPGILSGDANLDGTVNTTDFSLLAANFGGTVGVHWALGDFNLDGVINALDFNAIAANYGKGTPPSGSSAPALGSLVPEPVVALPALAGLLFSGRRRRDGKSVC